MLTTSQRQTIVDLQPYLTRIAYNIVLSYYPEQDPDDLLSVMNAYICDRADRDPEFLAQKPGYISRKAAWVAYDYCKRERYGRALQPQLLDREDDDGTLAAERIAAPLADLDLSIDVRAALATLDEKRQQIAAMLAAGIRRQEIAETFQVKSPSLSWDFQVIKRALAPVYAQATLVAGR